MQKKITGLQKKSSVILGIDPGTIIMGYGLIKVTGNQISLLEMGVLQPGKVSDSYKKPGIGHFGVEPHVVLKARQRFAHNRRTDARAAMALNQFF